MAKLKSLILLALLLLSNAITKASSVFCLYSDNLPVLLIAGTQHSGNDKSSSIIASINGHSLTVSFLSDIGQVTVKVLDENNLTLDLLTTPTPTGYLYYIPNAGRYTVVFTFADGDEYYGEFEVTD